VSVGEEDHIKPAVESLGTLDLWQIAMKPGKPFAYGQIPRDSGRAHFMGLPGNPVSSFLTFALLVRPFVLRLQGVQNVAPQSIAARADFTWPKADKRREFLRVRHNATGGLDLFDNQSSGVLTSCHRAVHRVFGAVVMKITVRYFASIREAIGQGSESVETSAATLGVLRDELIARGGAYASSLARGKAVRMALNQVLSDESAALADGAEVAFFPPVTGG